MEDTFKKHLAELSQYMQDNGINVYPLPKVQLNSQPQHGDSISCKTGYYDPQNKLVVLFTFGRHDKDILRSFAHEMIHHSQNLAGEMTPEKMGEGGDPKYAQNNGGVLSPDSVSGTVAGLTLRVNRQISGTGNTGLGDYSMVVINPDSYQWFESPRFQLPMSSCCIRSRFLWQMQSIHSQTPPCNPTTWNVQPRQFHLLSHNVDMVIV